MFVNRSVVGTVIQVGYHIIKVVAIQKPQVLLAIDDISKVFVPGTELRLPEGVVKLIRFQKGRRVYVGLEFPKDCEITVSNPHARIKSKTDDYQTLALSGCTSG